MGFDGYVVFDLEGFDGGVDGDDFIGGFVIEDVVVGYDYGVNIVVFLEVDVGVGDGDMLVWIWFGKGVRREGELICRYLCFWW